MGTISMLLQAIPFLKRLSTYLACTGTIHPSGAMIFWRCVYRKKEVVTIMCNQNSDNILNQSEEHTVVTKSLANLGSSHPKPSRCVSCWHNGVVLSDFTAGLPDGTSYAEHSNAQALTSCKIQVSQALEDSQSPALAEPKTSSRPGESQSPGLGNKTKAISQARTSLPQAQALRASSMARTQREFQRLGPS
jgi:hypothetical protein